MKFIPSRQLTIVDLSTADLERFGITIYDGVEPQPLRHLCFRDSVLTAEPDERGYCSFVVPDHGPMPWAIFEMLRNHFDCEFERERLMPAPPASSEDQRDAITDMLGVSELSDTDQLLQYACGKPHGIKPYTTLWQKAEIARVFVERNAELREDRNSSLLLSLVKHAYVRQGPPFIRNLKTSSGRGEAVS
jgi:hypothetical protein